MDFFNKLGNMASETYKYTADKTNKLAKEAKTRMKMNEYKSRIEEIYEEIGEIVYQKHVREEDINIKEDLQEYCRKIDELSEKVKQCRMELLNLKDKKQCEACYSEIEKDAKFCPKCGNEQPDVGADDPVCPQEVKEAEFVKDEEPEENIDKQEDAENND